MGFVNNLSTKVNETWSIRKDEDAPRVARGQGAPQDDRHAAAPRLSALAHEAIEVLSATAARPEYNVEMVFEQGDIQFINNYHILHARSAYVDAPELGLRRHLRRLWLTSPGLRDRPKHFRLGTARHWDRRRLQREQTMSRSSQ